MYLVSGTRVSHCGMTNWAGWSLLLFFVFVQSGLTTFQLERSARPDRHILKWVGRMYNRFEPDHEWVFPNDFSILIEYKRLLALEQM